LTSSAAASRSQRGHASGSRRPHGHDRRLRSAPNRIGIETFDAPLGPYLRINDEYETSVRGIFAAGDLAGPRYSITGAMHGGSLAAVGCHRSLLGTLEPLTGGVSSYI